MALLERSRDTIAPKLAKTYHETCSRQRPPARAGGRHKAPRPETEHKRPTPREGGVTDRPTNGTASFLSATRQDHRNASSKVAEESSQYLKLLYGRPLKKRHAKQKQKHHTFPCIINPQSHRGKRSPQTALGRSLGKSPTTQEPAAPPPFSRPLK